MSATIAPTPSSLGRRTVRGALWSISSSLATRAFGLIATLALTRFVAPGEYGEVAVAVVLVMTAQQVSTLGLGQYVIAHPTAGRDVVFHATAYYVGLGALALAALLPLGPSLGPVLEAPSLMRFLPWLLAGAVVDRLAFMPERVLVRDLRFARVSAARGLGEVAYGVCALALAVAGWGGMAIVAGNLLRSLVRAAVFLAGLDRREWLEPTRLQRGITRELFAFGVPLSLAALAGFAARRWDNLLIARFFGASTLGHYNLAYNLADVPAIQVGEHVGDVLLPSFARLDPERRRVALTRALGLLALLVFPLAVGLGAVAPTLVGVLFDPRWQPVGPMLVLLAALSVTRPVGWTVESYLQALGRARRLMLLEAGKAGLVVLALVTLGRKGPLWACAAVGVAFAVHAVAALWQVRAVDGIAWAKSLGALARPLVACIPLVLAVLAVRQFSGNAPGALRLAGECVAGAVVYVAAAHVVARATVDELVWRVRDALWRR